MILRHLAVAQSSKSQRWTVKVPEIDSATCWAATFTFESCGLANGTVLQQTSFQFSLSTPVDHGLQQNVAVISICVFVRLVHE